MEVSCTDLGRELNQFSRPKRTGKNMAQDTYLDWVIGQTHTKWWHDSAEAVELQVGLKRGAIGVTTNPYLANLALTRNRALWAAAIEEVLARNLPAELKAEALMQIVVTQTAEKLLPQYQASQGRQGYVCAQVNPSRAGDRDAMQAMARRFHNWAPNIAVKLPATSGGLDVLEHCVAEGITVTATVSFTVPQAVAIAERHRAGIRRARQMGIEPGKCFAVIMIGRLDDYMREVAHDNQVGVCESDIRQAGLAVTKRAYALYQERRYEAVLLVAALRGAYHLTELAGADLLMSIAPPYQEIFVAQDLPRQEGIQAPVPADVVKRLCQMPEFVRSYEPEGMRTSDFVGFGATQRTLSQFIEAGWRLMETYQ
jgi:transaldolase